MVKFENYSLKIDYETKILDFHTFHTRLITLYDTSKQRSIIFSKKTPFKAREIMEEMGLTQIAEENNIK